MKAKATLMTQFSVMKMIRYLQKVPSQMPNHISKLTYSIYSCTSTFLKTGAANKECLCGSKKCKACCGSTAGKSVKAPVMYDSPFSFASCFFSIPKNILLVSVL